MNALTDVFKTRPLRSSERPYVCGAQSLPLVIELVKASGITSAGVATHVAENRAAIQSLLYAHGALLFRGFGVGKDAEFEALVTSVNADTKAMPRYFMSEPGRERIAGTNGVLNTSSIYRTGGAFYLGGFHSENFYSTDVPSLQAFWCKEPPRLGGETGLVQSADAYADLPEDLKKKLGAERVFARTFSIASIAERYGVDEAKVEALCREVGLEIDSESGDVLLFKPALIEHPHTKRLALQIHISGEVPGFDAALRRQAAPSYRGWRWAAHRAAWWHPPFASVLPILDSRPLLLETMRSLFKRAPPKPPPRPARRVQSRLADRLTTEDAETLARIVWRHMSVFTWQRGDVLVCDQLQLMHAGMPGYGRDRDIHVMMCDPIQINHPITSGVLSAHVVRDHESIGERLLRV